MTGAYEQIDRCLLCVPDGSVPIEIALGPSLLAALIDDVTTDVTLRGDDVPINVAYRRQFPERLTWHDVAADWSGSMTRPAWEINREVLLHMRALKRERGISHYRGIPVALAEDEQIAIRWETIENLLRGKVVPSSTT